MKITMKFKNLLLENGKIERLDRELKSGKWLVRDPLIYRGRKEDESPVMKKKTTGGRKPKDTNIIVQEIVNLYHEKCYPSFPTRDEVRFGTTDKHWAMEFGKLYVIFPHQEATVYHSKMDPVHEFGAAYDGIKDFLKRFEKWYDNGGKWPNKEAKELALNFKKGIEDHNLMRKYVKNNPCVGDMLEKITNVQREIKKEHLYPEDQNWTASLLKFYSNIKRYFKHLEMGYPSEQKSSDEVVFKGRYLQVSKKLFDKYNNRESI